MATGMNEIDFRPFTFTPTTMNLPENIYDGLSKPVVEGLLAYGGKAPCEGSALRIRACGHKTLRELIRRGLIANLSEEQYQRRERQREVEKANSHLVRRERKRKARIAQIRAQMARMTARLEKLRVELATLTAPEDSTCEQTKRCKDSPYEDDHARSRVGHGADRSCRGSQEHR